MASADVVIRGGTIVDGTGAPAFVGDIAITGGIVSEVGESLAVAGLEDRCHGLGRGARLLRHPLSL